MVIDVAIGCSGGGSGGVIREGNAAGFNVLDIFDEELEMTLDFFGSLAANGVGDIEPAIGGVLVKDSQGSFKGFVLVGSPRARDMRGGGDGSHWCEKKLSEFEEFIKEGEKGGKEIEWEFWNDLSI